MWFPPFNLKTWWNTFNVQSRANADNWAPCETNQNHVMLYPFRRIGEHLEECLPSLESLILTNNNVQELGDLDNFNHVSSKIFYLCIILYLDNSLNRFPQHLENLEKWQEHGNHNFKFLKNMVKIGRNLEKWEVSIVF